MYKCFPTISYDHLLVSIWKHLSFVIPINVLFSIRIKRITTFLNYIQHRTALGPMKTRGYTMCPRQLSV